MAIYKSKFTGIEIDNILDKAKDSVIQVTYADLCILKNDNKLIPGKWYALTDYECKVKINFSYYDAYCSNSHNFIILILALSTNELCEECYAAQSLTDTYFENSDLSKWKIWYTITPNGKYDWIDANNKGVIYRMIDEFNNDCPYDFKNIKFNRNFDINLNEIILDDISLLNIGITMPYKAKQGFYTFDSSDSEMADASLDGFIKNNKIEPLIIDGVQHLNNIVFIDNCIENHILSNSKNSTIFECSGNKICLNNVLLYECETLKSREFKTIKSSLLISVTNSDFKNNDFLKLNNCKILDFGYNCANITIDHTCNNIIFGDACNNITIDHTCNNININKNCSDIAIGSNTFNLKIGSYCDTITIDGDCNHITIGNDCNTIFLSQACNNILIGINSTEIKFHGTIYNVTIGNNNYDITIDGDSEDINIGNDCYTIEINSANIITIGNVCSDIVLNNCIAIIIDNFCNTINIDGGSEAISIGNDCNHITIGNFGNNIIFGNGCQQLILPSYFNNIFFGNSILNLKIVANTTSTNKIQNYNFNSGIMFSLQQTITLKTFNQNYTTNVFMSKDGSLIYQTY